VWFFSGVWMFFQARKTLPHGFSPWEPSLKADARKAWWPPPEGRWFVRNRECVS
jgi:hypothetical protein